MPYHVTNHVVTNVRKIQQKMGCTETFLRIIKYVFNKDNCIALSKIAFSRCPSLLVMKIIDKTGHVTKLKIIYSHFSLHHLAGNNHQRLT